MLLAGNFGHMSGELDEVTSNKKLDLFLSPKQENIINR